MTLENVTIINAPDRLDHEGENGASPPLGCVRVAYAAKSAGANEYFIDGQHYPTVREVMSKLPEKTQIAGISYNMGSIDQTVALIKGIFDSGIEKILVGGQAVIPTAENFVKSFADSRIIACSGDGEPAIQGLVLGKSLEDIPNLVYFEDGQVRRTPAELTDYEDLNFEGQVNGFDWQSYFEYTQRFFGHNRASAYFTDGCPNRMGEDELSGCSFCTRRRTGSIRSVTPEQAYNHLKFLKEQGAEQININDDTFFASPGLLKGLAEQFEKKGELGLGLHVYARVSELTPQRLDLAQRIGVKSALVGIESGNSHIRKANGKPISDERILEAGRLCKERGISYDGAFIIGMIGETPQTAKDTVSLIRKLAQEGISQNSYADRFIPLPGCLGYHLIQQKLPSNPVLKQKYGNQFTRWDYDWSVLADAQLELNTSITREQAFNNLEEIRKINEASGVKPIIA
ncbi:radical SAM protein, partial [Candidatus Pacearchaeota archaeon]|nr:radical SAM protein [Candidatus Pacearchaeota archaeon]